MDKKSRILELSKQGIKQSKIAQIVLCSRQWVSMVLTGASDQPESAKHKLTNRANMGKMQQIWKQKVIKHYSKGANCCLRCGYNDMRALSIDHINAGGNRHRKLINSPFYAWLIRNRYPSGFQVLCMNCQWLKRVEHRETNYIPKRLSDLLI